MKKEKVAYNQLDRLDKILNVVYGSNTHIEYDIYNELYQHKIESTKKFITTIPTGHNPSTWKTAVHRENYDVIGNWLWKELNRCGDSMRNSERRCDLYLSRRSLLEPSKFKAMWENAYENRVCAITGTPLNFGLGETKELENAYFLATTGEQGISPSIERIDPEKEYTIDNVEIISQFENIGRNNGVNFERLRKERKAMQSGAFTKIMCS